MYISNFLNHSFVVRHLGCFHISAIVLRTTLNVNVHISFQVECFCVWGQMPKSGIAGLYRSSIPVFVERSQCSMETDSDIPINSG